MSEPEEEYEDDYNEGFEEEDEEETEEIEKVKDKEKDEDGDKEKDKLRYNNNNDKEDSSDEDEDEEIAKTKNKNKKGEWEWQKQEEELFAANLEAMSLTKKKIGIESKANEFESKREMKTDDEEKIDLDVTWTTSLISSFFCFLLPLSSFDVQTIAGEEGSLLLNLAQQGRIREIKKLLFYYAKKELDHGPFFASSKSSSSSSFSSLSTSFSSSSSSYLHDRDRHLHTLLYNFLLDEDNEIFVVNNLLYYQDLHGWNILHVGCNAQHDGLLSLLLEPFFNLSQLPVYVFSSKMKKDWKQKCRDLIITLLFQKEKLNGWTPLHIACIKGSVKCIRHILTFCFAELEFELELKDKTSDNTDNNDNNNDNKNYNNIEKSALTTNTNRALLHDLLMSQDALFDTPLDLLTNVSTEEKMMIDKYWIKGKVYMDLKEVRREENRQLEKNAWVNKKSEEDKRKFRERIMATIEKEKFTKANKLNYYISQQNQQQQQHHHQPQKQHQQQYQLIPTNLISEEDHSTSRGLFNNDGNYHHRQNNIYNITSPVPVPHPVQASATTTSTAAAIVIADSHPFHLSSQFIDKTKFRNKAVIENHIPERQEKEKETINKFFQKSQNQVGQGFNKGLKVGTITKTKAEKGEKRRKEEKEYLQAKIDNYISPYSYSSLQKNSYGSSRYHRLGSRKDSGEGYSNSNNSKCSNSKSNLMTGGPLLNKCKKENGRTEKTDINVHINKQAN